MRIASEEWSQVWSGLTNNEVIHVEEFADAMEWGRTIAIRSVCPGTECNLLSWTPWHDDIILIFAVESHWIVQRGRGRSVGREGGRPYQLFKLSVVKHILR